MYLFVFNFKKKYLFKTICLIILSIFLLSCSGDISDNSDETGKAAFNLSWPQSITKKTSQNVSSQRYPAAGLISCDEIGVSDIICKVYKASGDLVTQKSFLCSDHTGVIYDLPLNTGLRFNLEGRGANGTVRYKGEKRDVVLNSSDTADLGVIEMDFVTDSNRAPDVVITNPSTSDVFNEFENITFSGAGSDKEDGDLTGNRLVWTSDIDGNIGTGQSIYVGLTPGNHIITLTATDNNGESSTVEINIRIEPVTQTHCYALLWMCNVDALMAGEAPLSDFPYEITVRFDYGPDLFLSYNNFNVYDYDSFVYASNAILAEAGIVNGTFTIDYNNSKNIYSSTSGMFAGSIPAISLNMEDGSVVESVLFGLSSEIPADGEFISSYETFCESF